ncbi:uncharacterized protein LOC110440367 isoform X2 [Mizuhopecten yessoensis]|uniref:uncharacterized protein LOC110440367 isoform X2 n=1 Tax=Mizuhopecten yessoensis TaxID=6573 RepID=UPI000B45F1B4|nr:uncharacterized protein LOC110440367 isoform X2 [Mizuhopecten yessoensis]
MGIGALLWILFLVRYSECTCTLPTNLVGSWTSSEQGSMTFTSTSLLSYPTTTFGTFTFTCDSYSGSQYVLKSPSFTYLTLPFEAYLCLVLTEISSTKFTYFIGTETNSYAGNDRLKTSNPSTTLNVSDVCDRSSYPTGTYYVLVKDGEINSAQTDCPTDLLGQWTYTYNNGSGSDVCSGNTTSADVCNTTTGISLSYTSCSQMVMYSSSGFLYCLYSFTDSSMTYINLYNTDSTTDESSTYRFTCLVMTESGDDRYITQYPKQCHENQNSSSVLSPGTSLVFSLSSTCATSDVVSAATLAVALAVVIPLIVIIVACIISYFCWVNYQKKKIEEAARPDPKFANGEIRNRRKNIHDGVIHPDQNGIMIRREESIVISVPLSARDDDNQSPLSELDDYGQDVDSDDDEYEVKDITEFSLTDDIPEIVVHSATPNPRDDNPVETGTDVKSAKIKKKRRRRRKSARSRVSTITESRQDADIKTKRKSHSHMAMNEEGKDGLPDVDEKEKVAPSDKPTVKEESLREKAYKMRMKKGETLADLIKKKKKVPILKHPMESSYQDLPNGKPPTSSWGSRRGTTPKTAPSLIQVEQADINDDSMVMFRRAITDLELKPQESSRVKVPEKVTFFEPSKPGGDLWKQMRGMWNLASHAISNPNVGSSSALQSAKKKKKGKVRKIQI